MLKYRSFWITCVCLVVFTFFLGCGEDDSGDDIIIDPESAEEKVYEANDLLANALNDFINGPEPEEMGDIDFSEPYNTYLEALNYDYTNPTANFGAGLLELMMLSQNSDFEEMFNRIVDLMEDDSLFEAGGGSLFRNGGIIFNPAEVKLPMMIPLHIAGSQMNSYKSIQEDNHPTISEIQDMIIDEVLTVFELAINRLNRVTADENFVFMVTPRMQGDMNEDPVELDLTEVYTTIAAVNVIRAYLYQFVSYDLDFDDYTGEAMVDALSQGSSFLTLRQNGQTYMANALNAWRDGVEALVAGVMFLENEADNQFDDLIRIDPYDGISQADLDTMKSYFPHITSSLNSEAAIYIDHDGNPDNDDERIVISLKNFFDPPVTDLKTLAPGYTVSLDSQVVDREYIDEYLYEDNINVNVTEAGFYYWYRDASWEYGELYYTYEQTDFTSETLEILWNQYVEMLADKPYARLQFNFGGHLDAGDNTISIAVYYNYESSTRMVYMPVFTWDANSFGEWILPDPTFGGLLPEMTDQRFKYLFDITGDNWQKSGVWNWWWF